MDKTVSHSFPKTEERAPSAELSKNFTEVINPIQNKTFLHSKKRKKSTIRALHSGLNAKN